MKKLNIDSNKLEVKYISNNLIEVRWYYSQFFYSPFWLCKMTGTNKLESMQQQGMIKYLVFNSSLIIILFIVMLVFDSDDPLFGIKAGTIFIILYLVFLYGMGKLGLTLSKKELLKVLNQKAN